MYVHITLIPLLHVNDNKPYDTSTTNPIILRLDVIHESSRVTTVVVKISINSKLG